MFVLFGAIENPSGALFAFTAIEIVWEASLAIYLTVKGYRPSPLLAESEARGVQLGPVKHLTLRTTAPTGHGPSGALERDCAVAPGRGSGSRGHG